MKIDLKQALLYAIVPALIAGLFSIAPKVYEVVTEPRAALRYALVSGPKVDIDGVQQQVISVKVFNPGRKALTAIRAELVVPGGSVVAASVENSSGLLLELKKSEEQVVVQVPKALEGESFSISALLRKNQSAVEPRFNLRSEEVLGEQEIPKGANSGGIASTWLSGIGSALSVLAMALWAMTKFMWGIGPTKRNAIVYIAICTKIDGFIKAVRAEGESISYMDFADMLLILGDQKSVDCREAAVAGLRCLLGIKDIAEESKQIARRNLLALQGTLNAGDANGTVSISNVEKFRNFVDETFQRRALC